MVASPVVGVAGNQVRGVRLEGDVLAVRGHRGPSTGAVALRSIGAHAQLASRPGPAITDVHIELAVGLPRPTGREGRTTRADAEATGTVEKYRLCPAGVMVRCLVKGLTSIAPKFVVANSARLAETTSVRDLRPLPVKGFRGDGIDCELNESDA